MTTCSNQSHRPYSRPAHLRASSSVPAWVRLGYRDEQHYKWGELLQKYENHFNVYFCETPKKHLSLQEIRLRFKHLHNLERQKKLQTSLVTQRLVINQTALTDAKRTHATQSNFSSKRISKRGVLTGLTLFALGSAIATTAPVVLPNLTIVASVALFMTFVVATIPKGQSRSKAIKSLS